MGKEFLGTVRDLFQFMLCLVLMTGVIGVIIAWLWQVFYCHFLAAGLELAAFGSVTYLLDKYLKRWSK